MNLIRIRVKYQFAERRAIYEGRAVSWLTDVRIGRQSGTGWFFFKSNRPLMH